MYYDNNFPVFEISEEHFFIELAKKSHLIFSKEDLEEKYILSEKFTKLVEDCLSVEFDYIDIDSINIQLQQDILALNTQRGSYGVIFPETIVCMCAGGKFEEKYNSDTQMTHGEQSA